jgi:hypothetical protein
MKWWRPEYERDRSRRVHPVRARSIEKRMGQRELAALRTLNAADEDLEKRPTTRGECERGERPCPFVSCQYHLYLDVSSHGSIKLNFPDLEPWEIPVTCALDVASDGGVSLERIGSLINLTRERVRQLEESALRKLGSFAELYR